MKIFYAVIFLLCFTFSLNAQIENGETNEKKITKGLVKLLEGPSNLGREYWLSVPPPYLVSDPTNYTRFFIAASGDANVRIRQESGVDISMFVPSGTAKSFDLKPGECQPYIHNYATSPKAAPAQVYPAKGLHITSDQPIIVYVMIRYRYTSDGYLALPVQGLGTKYVSTVYDARELNGSDLTAGNLPNMLTIVAPYDRTKVDFTLGGKDISKVEVLGGKILRPGDKQRWTMNKGDVLVLSNIDADETLSGSLIESDKPVAVISGQYCTDIPLRVRACDYTVEMDLPMHGWGQVYNIPYMRNRDKPSILRVFARDPGTTVWRDGQEVMYLSNGVGKSGGMIQQAWDEIRVWPIGLTPSPAVYTADKPIYVSLYNPSSQDDGKPTDPFSMIITPVEQYQNRILFCTPAAAGGLNFGANFLNIIFEADENGLVPEDMTFGEVKGDVIEYSTVRTKFGSNADLMYKIGSGGDNAALENTGHNGRIFAEKQILLPGDGIFVIESSTLFACYSSGVDNYDSYGFPTSTALRVISNDTLPPSIYWTMDCFGNIEGTTTDNPDPDDDGVRVGLNIPELQWDDLINYTDFKYDENNFIPGTETTAWSLKVADPTKYARAIVIFSDLSGNTSRDTIEYYPELIDLREVAADNDNNDLYYHNHGVVGLNETHTMRYEIENLSDSRTFSLNEVKLKFKDQNFTIEPLGWNLTDPFAPREIREFTITFETNLEGRFQDSIGLSTECNDKFYARIEAETGIPGITVDDYGFPTQTLDADGNNTPVVSTDLRISNRCNGVEGSQPLVITGFTGPTNPEFTHNLNNLTFPLTIQPNEQVSFKVTFTPTAVGDLTDQIIFLTDKDLGCDPVCEITARVTQPGLLAQENDWGKVRIDYPKQANVYSPVNELITATNTSSGTFASNLRLTNIIFESVNGPIGNPFEAFSFDQNFATAIPANPNNYFRNVPLAPGASTPQRMLYFRPQVVGAYEIAYYFESDAEATGSETKYVVKGHGIVPNMTLYYDDAGTEEYDNVDFGVITAGVPSEAVTRTLNIVNRPLDTDNGDILTISAINWGPNVSRNLANAGGLPFAVDEQAILDAFGTNGAYPIVLDINEELSFDVVYYTNQADVAHIANITITSDADESGNTGNYNGDITLNGTAVRPGILLTTSDIYSCISNPLVIDENYPNYDNMYTVTNSGTKDVTINKLEFVPTDGNPVGYTLSVDEGIVKKADGSADVRVASTANTSLDNVVLSAGDKMIVLLTYTPSAKYDVAGKSIEMVVETDIVNPADQPAPLSFELTSNNFVKATTSLVKKDDGNALNPLNERINYNIDSHRNLDYVVSLDANPDIVDAALSTLDITVEYRRSYLTYDNLEGVELLGNYANGYDILNLNTSYRFEQNATKGNKYDVIEVISFTVNGQGNNVINAGGDFFVVHFNTGIPNIPATGLTDGNMNLNGDQLYLEGRDQGSTETYINTSLVDPSGSACASITSPAQITIDLDPVCGMGLRPLSLSDFTNSASLISPNPVTSSGASIEFSIAFDSETVVRIIDTKGEIVAVLNNSKLNAGEHTLNIPVEKLANGVYFYEIESTDLKVKDKFIVNK